jgi:Ca2+-binding RTX toxin-like protein
LGLLLLAACLGSWVTPAAAGTLTYGASGTTWGPGLRYQSEFDEPTALEVTSGPGGVVTLAEGGDGLILPNQSPNYLPSTLLNCSMGLKSASCRPDNPPINRFEDVRFDLSALSDSLVTDVGTFVWAMQGDDVITGSAESDYVIPDAGADVVSTGAGDDHIAGRHKLPDGEDVFDSGPGDDDIYAFDGFRDTITCGPGADTVTVDPVDAVAGDCELPQLGP